MDLLLVFFICFCYAHFAPNKPFNPFNGSAAIPSILSHQKLPGTTKPTIGHADWLKLHRFACSQKSIANFFANFSYFAFRSSHSSCFFLASRFIATNCFNPFVCPYTKFTLVSLVRLTVLTRCLPKTAPLLTASSLRFSLLILASLLCLQSTVLFLSVKFFFFFCVCCLSFGINVRLFHWPHCCPHLLSSW